MMNDKEYKVSIVVPIYNVENYLDRCIESIVEQTYSNIEILLVDDGSSDRSGIIAENWEKKESRIKLIHKENGGLSAARNTGIDNATGDYLIFVDSDDWIDRTMVEKLVKGLKDADVVCCGMKQSDGYECEDLPWISDNIIISGKEAVNLLVENTYLTSHVQRNIFPKRFFDSERFPEGKIFEDIRTTHKLFLQANKVCIIQDCLYYYFMRANSITNIVKLKNRIEWYDALNERYNDLCFLLSEEQREMIVAQRAIVMSLSIVQNKFEKEEKEKYKCKMDSVKAFLNSKDTKNCVKRNCTKSQCIYYFFAMHFFYFSNVIYQIIRRKNK